MTNYRKAVEAVDKLLILETEKMKAPNDLRRALIMGVSSCPNIWSMCSCTN